MAALKSIKNIFQSKRDSTNNIDYNMQLSKNKEKRTIRILLLGPGDSGKSTIVKQMKKIYSALSEDDMKLMAPYIQSAVVGYIKLLCFQCKELFENDDEKSCKIQPENESLRQEILNLDSHYELDQELATKIATLWADSALKETLKFRAKFQIHDNVNYFLDKIEALTGTEYIPDFEDYLRIRTRSTGFSMTTINAKFDKFGDYTFEFTDVGGQRSERKKWMQIVVDQIQAVLFVIALSEYDLKCFEDNKTNRMQEALNLFTEVARGNFLNGKSVLLFFNKYDLFKEKIKTVPITVAFDDYPESNDAHDETQVIEFVANKFTECLDGKEIKLASAVHIHRTTALDTNNIHTLFTDITLDLIKLNFSQCGMV